VISDKAAKRDYVRLATSPSWSGLRVIVRFAIDNLFALIRNKCRALS
jgi:hypothetical protein